MPRNRTINQTKTVSIATRPTAASRSGRKAPGTRLGILEDWREGSSKSGVTSVGIAKSIRDGR
jgi:hypothetical protein